MEFATIKEMQEKAMEMLKKEGSIDENDQEAVKALREESFEILEQATLFKIREAFKEARKFQGGSPERYEVLLDATVSLTAGFMAGLERGIPKPMVVVFEDAVVTDLLNRVTQATGRMGAVEVISQPGEDCDNCPIKATCSDYRPGGYKPGEPHLTELQDMRGSQPVPGPMVQ